MIGDSIITEHRVQSEKATDLLEKSKDLNIVFLQVRRTEKYFLIRKAPKYIERHNKIIAKVYEVLGSMKGISADEAINNPISSIQEHFKV